MAIERSIPSPDTYSFVVIRTDKDASTRHAQPMRFATYNENTVSRSIEWNGRRVHALFLKHQETAKRAWRLGWQDVTASWRERLTLETPKPTTQAQEAILGALGPDWMVKSDIIDSAGIKDSEWRTAIRYLIEKGLVATNGSDRGVSNRRYVYRLAERG